MAENATKISPFESHLTNFPYTPAGSSTRWHLPGQFVRLRRYCQPCRLGHRSLFCIEGPEGIAANFTCYRNVEKVGAATTDFFVVRRTQFFCIP